jgi:hypothetical protein
MKTPTLLAPLLTGPYAEKYPQPTYVLLQNGLNVERDLYDAIEKLRKGPPSIISAALWIATNLQEGNVVVHGDFVCIITFFPFALFITSFHRTNCVLGCTDTTTTPQRKTLPQKWRFCLTSVGW